MPPLIFSLKKKIKKLTEERWSVGFIQTQMNDILNGSTIHVNWIKHSYKKSWFADPFILDITDNEIILLVEEFYKPSSKGRISKLTIDRKTKSLLKCEVVLELPTHLSFPYIIRKEDKLSLFISDLDSYTNDTVEPFVYMLPENGESGALNIYKYFPQSNKILLLGSVLDEGVEDAVPLFYENQVFLFCTPRKNPNGNILHIYKWSPNKKKFVYEQALVFRENVARMSGAFFYDNESLIRPTQECNSQYGHAVTFQVTDIANLKFKEIRRLYSVHPKLNIGCHTFNSYRGVIVTDALGFERIWIRKILRFLNLI